MRSSGSIFIHVIVNMNYTASSEIGGNNLKACRPRCVRSIIQGIYCVYIYIYIVKTGPKHVVVYCTLLLPDKLLCLWLCICKYIHTIYLVLSGNNNSVTIVTLQRARRPGFIFQLWQVPPTFMPLYTSRTCDPPSILSSVYSYLSVKLQADFRLVP
jgi:hypothetical protein